MKRLNVFLLANMLLCPLLATAQLAVTVMPPNLVGGKTVVFLAMTNNLAESVESARAICFLLDDQGKMVGRSTKWVIGGTIDRPPLQPKAGTTFNFVITSTRPFATTNFVAKISFSRLVLAGGKLADPSKDVAVAQPAQK
jgi:hypothetical protein